MLLASVSFTFFSLSLSINDFVLKTFFSFDSNESFTKRCYFQLNINKTLKVTFNTDDSTARDLSKGGGAIVLTTRDLQSLVVQEVMHKSQSLQLPLKMDIWLFSKLVFIVGLRNVPLVFFNLQGWNLALDSSTAI